MCVCGDGVVGVDGGGVVSISKEGREKDEDQGEVITEGAGAAAGVCVCLCVCVCVCVCVCNRARPPHRVQEQQQIYVLLNLGPFH